MPRKKISTTVYITPEQDARLKQLHARTKVPVAYTMEPVTVEGRFAVLADDPYGLYYRVTEAVTVK